MKKIIVLSIAVAAILIIILIAGYASLARINHVEIDKTDEALGISAETEIEKQDIEELTPKKRDDIVNIVLFGLDRTEPNENSRSDSMIVLTLDFKNKKIKLSSLMRDMYVFIEGYGQTKLNHAYAYGGASLAIKTINQNFGTNIRDYAAVDFSTLEKIIDILGGVTINIKQEEISEINTINSNAKITNSGKQLLNGKQAVAYSRIRYVGNGDFERTERQRRVLLEILRKAKETEITTLPDLASEILPLVETSMEKQTILDMSADFFKAGEMTYDQERFPINGYYWDDMTDGIYYLKFDTEITKQQVMDYIFNDIKPIPRP